MLQLNSNNCASRRVDMAPERHLRGLRWVEHMHKGQVCLSGLRICQLEFIIEDIIG